jgi:hypothetical protein
VAGCDGVFHVASPIIVQAITDPQVWFSLFNLFGCYFFQDAKFITSLDCLVFKNYMFKNHLLSVYWGKGKPISFQLSHVELRKERQLSLGLFFNSSEDCLCGRHNSLNQR